MSMNATTADHVTHIDNFRPRGWRHGRSAGDRIRKLSAECRDAKARAAFAETLEKDLDATSKRAERHRCILEAILKKLPKDMRGKLQEHRIMEIAEMADQDFGALLVHIEHMRSAR